MVLGVRIGSELEAKDTKVQGDQAVLDEYLVQMEAAKTMTAAEAQELLKDKPNPSQFELDQVSMALMGFTAHESIFGRGALKPAEQIRKEKYMSGGEARKAVRAIEGINLEEVEQAKPTGASISPIKPLPPNPPASGRLRGAGEGPLPLATWISDKGVMQAQDVVIANGPPERPWSLFPPNDPVLPLAQRNRASYRKHLIRKVGGGFEDRKSVV